MGIPLSRKSPPHNLILPLKHDVRNCTINRNGSHSAIEYVAVTMSWLALLEMLASKGSDFLRTPDIAVYTAWGCGKSNSEKGFLNQKIYLIARATPNSQPTNFVSRKRSKNWSESASEESSQQLRHTALLERRSEMRLRRLAEPCRKIYQQRNRSGS